MRITHTVNPETTQSNSFCFLAQNLMRTQTRQSTTIINLPHLEYYETRPFRQHCPSGSP